MWLSWLPPLNIPSNNLDVYTIPGRVREASRFAESVELRTGAYENEPDLLSLGSTTTARLLRGAGTAAGAFGPLKSVAGGLSFILKNQGVWPSCSLCHPQHLQFPQLTNANKQAIESLAPRIQKLVENLSKPVPTGDVKEEIRRNELER